MANYARVANFGDPLEDDWQKKNLVTVVAPNGQKFTVHKDAAPSFQGLLNDLGQSGYDVKSDGGFNYRNIRGSDKLSQHAFGNAIDINAATNPLGSAKTDLPRNVSDLAANRGLEWGGNWQSRPDPMHFEWTGKPVTTVNSPAADGFEMPSGSPSSYQPTMFAKLPRQNMGTGDYIAEEPADVAQQSTKNDLASLLDNYDAPKKPKPEELVTQAPTLSVASASPGTAMMLAEMLKPRRMRGLL